MRKYISIEQEKEEEKYYKIFKPYLKIDEKGHFYLPEGTPKEAIEARKKCLEVSIKYGQ